MDTCCVCVSGSSVICWSVWATHRLQQAEQSGRPQQQSIKHLVCLHSILHLSLHHYTHTHTHTHTHTISSPYLSNSARTSPNKSNHETLILFGCAAEPTETPHALFALSSPNLNNNGLGLRHTQVCTHTHTHTHAHTHTHTHTHTAIRPTH